MKDFYVESSVKYTNPNDGKPFNDTEFYTSIIQANSLKIAENIAKEDVLKIFNEEINDEFENIYVEIIQSYETSDDARS